MSAYHARSIQETQIAFNTGHEGLNAEQVAVNARRFGVSTVPLYKRKPVYKAVAGYVVNVMNGALIAAAIVLFVLGDVLAACAMLAVVGVNVALGAYQAWDARRLPEAFHGTDAPPARVVRSGKTVAVTVREIVPGDIVLLETGDTVPADVRLTEAHGLKVSEATLTGDPTPSEKDADAVLDEACPLADRANMAFCATEVIGGSGAGIVVAVGADTQAERIAHMLDANREDASPLKKRMGAIINNFGYAALGVCAVIVVVGLIYGREWPDMLLMAAASVAASLPVGLGAVTYAALKMGARRMARQGITVRSPYTVEALGGVTVICSGKTGSLTRNMLTVTKVYTPGSERTIDEAAAFATPGETELLKAAALCTEDADNGHNRIDVALADAAYRLGMRKIDLDQAMPRVGGTPFNAGHRRMSTVHRLNGGYIIYVKGAPDAVLPLVTRIRSAEGERAIDDGDMRMIGAACASLAGEALRVLCVAGRRMERLPIADGEEGMEKELTFLGLVAMADPPRPEAAGAVKRCADAGVRTIMLTGDNKAAAIAVARAVGIMEPDGASMTGDEVDAADDLALDDAVRRINVYAQLSPDSKARIVDALRLRGEVVVMTGDGANDAPAIKRADIGAVVSASAAAAAHEAADMAISDHSFAHIVRAVEEGRRVYDNVRKAVQFLLTACSGGLLLMLASALLNTGTPILPLQALLVGGITDVMLALALGGDRAAAGLMKRPPRRGSLFTRGMAYRVAYQGAMIGAVTLAAYMWGLNWGINVAVSIAFATFALSQLAHMFGVRSRTRPVFKCAISPGVLMAALGVLSVVLSLLMVPRWMPLIQVLPLGWPHAGVIALCSLIPMLLVEVFKRMGINTVRGYDM